VDESLKGRQSLEEKLSRNAETVFWLVYVLVVPLSTGILAYNWLPHESYRPDRDELLNSHEVTDEDRTGTVYDAWRDKKTGAVYTIVDFEQHRRSEAKRLFWTWFFYGLIVCFFFAFRQHRLSDKKFVVSLVKALVVNLVIALGSYITQQATNDRIIQ
jgi:hypothetical protein